MDDMRYNLEAWDSIQTLGIWLVIIGVVGESVELLTKWGCRKSFRQKFSRLIRRILVRVTKWAELKSLGIETFFFALLVVGLCVEYWGGSHFQATLTKENSALREKMVPRNLKLAQIEKFKRLTLSVKKIPIKVTVDPNSEESIQYAVQIRQMLDQAKFGNYSGAEPHGIFFDEDYVTLRIVTNEVLAAKMPTIAIKYNGKLSKLEMGKYYQFRAQIYHGETNPDVPENAPNELAIVALEACFKQIGIPIEIFDQNDSMQSGEFEIYVLPKPYW